MGTRTVDAVVIGAGPGGYVAGIRLAQLGQKTLVVEKEYMGGVCLNWGCIPSKALIAAANFLERVKHAETMGIKVSGVEVDVGKMQDWKESIVKKLTSGVGGLLKGNGAEHLFGTAKLTGPKSLEVQTKEGVEKVEVTKGIILATGARPIEIPGFKFDGEHVVNARHAVSFREAPKRLVIIGGGVIGLELGTVYAKLGSQVTVIELMPQLLPGTDLDLVKVVQKKLEKLGCQIHVEARARSAEVAGGAVRVTAEIGGKSQVIEADKVLVSVGFRPNSEGLGLEAAGVKTDAKGFVPVDIEMRTNVKSVYAIGDLCGPPLLAHKASKEGEIAAEVIAGHKAANDVQAMPAAIFTDPEIATVGMTETEAKAKGKEVSIGKFPFAASGRAMAVLETDGFIKVIADKASHQVLGVGIVGPEASDLISEAALAIEMGAFVEDVGLTVHPHPTLSEAMMEAMKHAIREAVHILNR
jgi:dihydrolipoamide dehydrogenase